MYEIALSHDGYLVGIAFTLAALGAAAAMATYNASLKYREMRMLHWIAISAIMSGGYFWTVAFVLHLAYFVGVPEGFNVAWSVVAAVYLVASTVASQIICRKRNLPFSSMMSRLLSATGLPMACYLSLASFNGWHGFGESCVVVLAGATIVMLMQDRFARPRRLGRVRTKRLLLISLTRAATICALHPALLWSLESHTMSLETVRTFSIPSIQLIMPLVVAMIFLTLVGCSAFFIDRAATAESVMRYRRLAMHDSLTGLPNRLNMEMTLDTQIMQHKDGDPSLAVAVIDLDRFKDVNDVHGHAAGDSLLKEMGQHIAERLREGEVLYRTGGDEFVAIKARVSRHRDAVAFAERISGSLDNFDAWMTGNLQVTASVGLCLFPQDGQSSGELLSCADLAMYRAKALGRNQISVFDSGMDEARRTKKALAMDLRRAIDFDELEIHWQPQVESSSGKLVGFEALLRWDHRERGPISPAEFIPLAEQTGQILDIGDWVLRHACAEAAQWTRPYKIAINVAAGQLNQSDLPQLVGTVLEETGLTASRLELEVTETGIIRDQAAAYEAVNAIKTLGVRIAMDDFGTGYSSLSTLQTFPFDKLKIDRAFVGAMGEAKSADVIVESTIRIAQAMGLVVLAEGVETRAQMEILHDFGCHEMQGFYFSRPLSTEEARARYNLMRSTLEEFDQDTRSDLASDAGSKTPPAPGPQTRPGAA